MSGGVKLGFMDKMKFWKKDDFDDFDFGDSKSDPFADMGSSPSPPGSQDPGFGQQSQDPMQFSDPMGGQDPSGFPPSQETSNPMGSTSQPFHNATFQQPQQSGQSDYHNYTVGKEIEIISSKLDALRASIDSISQRLSNLERMAEADIERRRSW